MSPRHALRMTTDRGYAPNAPGWTYHVVAWNELPRDVALTAIERVVLLDLSMEASMPTVLRELPNVRSLAKIASLRELQIGPVKDAASLTPFEALPLRALSLNRGNLASLAPVARFGGLTTFGAMNCHAFKDLAPLAKITSLTEVWFNTCAGIEKAEALVDLPKLARVKFWGCRDNGGALKKACKKLMAHGVAVETELFA